MLYKTNFWMRTIGSVLLDFILVTLSQNWGTYFELVAKRRKDSNSLLISLWFLDLFINLFQKEKKTHGNNPYNVHCQFNGQPTV